MEIIATNTDTFGYICALIIVSGFAIVFVLLAVASIQVRAFGLALLNFFAAFAIAACFHSSGPEVTYEARITDFNVVYDRGYEIVGHHGEIYEIRKDER